MTHNGAIRILRYAERLHHKDLNDYWLGEVLRIAKGTVGNQRLGDGWFKVRVRDRIEALSDGRSTLNSFIEGFHTRPDTIFSDCAPWLFGTQASLWWLRNYNSRTKATVEAYIEKTSQNVRSGICIMGMWKQHSGVLRVRLCKEHLYKKRMVWIGITFWQVMELQGAVAVSFTVTKDYALISLKGPKQNAKSGIFW